MVAVGIVLLPQERWASARRKWEQAEEWGFDHAWTYDHLAWRTLVDEPWFATVPLLAAAAAVTERIGLGTGWRRRTSGTRCRSPRTCMGLDDISGGRFLLGLGAGGEGFDASVTGDPPTRGERTRRFEEFVGLLDSLLTQPVTSHQGEFYRADEARMIPGTIAQPRTPFVVAANGPRTMALAARYGQGWATYGPAYATEDVPDRGRAPRRSSGGRVWRRCSSSVDAIEALRQARGRAAAAPVPQPGRRADLLDDVAGRGRPRASSARRRWGSPTWWCTGRATRASTPATSRSWRPSSTSCPRLQALEPASAGLSGPGGPPRRW